MECVQVWRLWPLESSRSAGSEADVDSCDAQEQGCGVHPSAAFPSLPRATLFSHLSAQ